MDTPTAAAIAGIAVVQIVGFTRTIRSLGRMEAKFNIMWSWFSATQIRRGASGRRYYDPRHDGDADDNGSGAPDDDS